jgi:hypothetical protein
MSQPSFEASPAPTVLTKRSAWNVYTVMLLIALVCLLAAALFLYLEIREYGGFGNVKGPFTHLRTPAASVATVAYA